MSLPFSGNTGVWLEGEGRRAESEMGFWKPGKQQEKKLRAYLYEGLFCTALAVAPNKNGGTASAGTKKGGTASAGTKEQRPLATQVIPELLNPSILPILFIPNLLNPASSHPVQPDSDNFIL